MRERDWEALVWSLQHGNCILLLGSGAAPPADPSLTALLADQLTMPPLAGASLPHVAQRYVHEFGRSDLERQIVGFHAAHAEDPSPVHEKLASLPFSFVVSAAHDGLLARELRKKGKPPLAGCYDFRGDNPELCPTGTAGQPLVYQLYGDVAQPESLVVTENDLLEFLVAVVSKNPPMPSNIRSELQKQGKSFLFIGFGIRQWYVRILLHALKFHRAETRSFAFEPFQPGALEDEQTILFYKTGYRIDVFNYETEGFVDELLRRVPAEPAAAEDRPPVSPLAPKVFICHASENKPAAESVYRALVGAGIDAWLDRASLEGGAAYDREIEERLTEADYFVVLQSEALHRKTFSYVNKEISLALNRQRYARQGIKFIIPLLLEDAPLLPELREFQALPLRGTEDLTALISTIRRDHQRRLRQ